MLAAVSPVRPFGLGGALIQAVTRNPLASPDVIGITQGAGLAGDHRVDRRERSRVAPAAMAGGLLAAALVFAFGAKKGFSANRFVLAGVAVAFALRAGSRSCMTSAEVDRRAAGADLADRLAQRARVRGGDPGRDRPVGGAAGPAVGGLGAADHLARRRRRRAGSGCGRWPGVTAWPAVGVVLAAAATAQVGAVDFVALVAPQIARRLARAERPPLLASALAGAALVVLADFAGRWICSPRPSFRPAC